MNLNNFSVFIGRLASDPKFFDNADGSRKCRITLMCEDNYAVGGVRGKTSIQAERFLRAGSEPGVFGLIHQGDLIMIQTTAKNNNWEDKDGAKHYDVINQIDQVEMLETKAVTAARLAEKQAAAAGSAE